MKKLNYQVHLSFLAGTAFVAALTGCVLPGQSSGSASPVTTTSDGSSSSPTPSSTPSPSPSPTPTYGMNCSGTFGWDSLGSYPVMFVGAINGSSVNSVKLNLHGNGLGTSNVVGSITLTAYTCGTSSSLGANVATATWNHTSLNGNDAEQTFTFSSPVTIPTNCAPGEKPLAFKVTYSGFGGAAVYAHEVLSTSTCFMSRSTSATGLVASPHSFTGIIDANP